MWRSTESRLPLLSATTGKNAKRTKTIFIGTFKNLLAGFLFSVLVLVKKHFYSECIWRAYDVFDF